MSGECDSCLRITDDLACGECQDKGWNEGYESGAAVAFGLIGMGEAIRMRRVGAAADPVLAAVRAFEQAARVKTECEHPRIRQSSIMPNACECSICFKQFTYLEVCSMTGRT